MSPPAPRLTPELLGLDRANRVAAPLREQIADALRQAILEFRFEPQQRLVERELIEMTGVSRTTVREVLRGLESEGLVKIVPQRGAIVDVPSVEEAGELYEVRALLEEFTAKRFIERGGEADLAALIRAHKNFNHLAKTRPDDILELLHAKDEFYRVLLDGSGSSVVRTLLGQLQARVRLLRARSLSKPGRPQESAAELHDLIKAIEAKDVDRAVAICHRHVEKASASGKEMAERQAAEAAHPDVPQGRVLAGRQ